MVIEGLFVQKTSNVSAIVLRHLVNSSDSWVSQIVQDGVNHSSIMVSGTMLRTRGTFPDLRYDFRLHRIHVSPTLRMLISSLFSESNIIIIGIRNRTPGNKESSTFNCGRQRFVNSFMMMDTRPSDATERQKPRTPPASADVDSVSG